MSDQNQAPPAPPQPPPGPAPTAPTGPLGVFAAISAVQSELAASGIAKGQENSHDRYRFRGIDDVFNALGPVLARHGLLILPRVRERQVTERTARSGGAVYQVVLRVEYDFVAAADGSMYTVEAFGEAMDRGDKATPKAMAAAFKYAVFQAFCIPTEGTPDADTDSYQAGPARAAGAAPPAVGYSPDRAPVDGSVSTGQAARLKAQLEATGADVAAFCRHFNIAAVDQLGAAQFTLASRMLARKAQASAAAIRNDNVKQESPP